MRNKLNVQGQIHEFYKLISLDRRNFYCKLMYSRSFTMKNYL